MDKVVILVPKLFIKLNTPEYIGSNIITEYRYIGYDMIGYTDATLIESILFHTSTNEFIKIKIKLQTSSTYSDGIMDVEKPDFEYPNELSPHHNDILYFIKNYIKDSFLHEHCKNIFDEIYNKLNESEYIGSYLINSYKYNTIKNKKDKIISETITLKSDNDNIFIINVDDTIKCPEEFKECYHDLFLFIKNHEFHRAFSLIDKLHPTAFFDCKADVSSVSPNDMIKCRYCNCESVLININNFIKCVENWCSYIIDVDLDCCSEGEYFYLHINKDKIIGQIESSNEETDFKSLFSNINTNSLTLKNTNYEFSAPILNSDIKTVKFFISLYKIVYI